MDAVTSNRTRPLPKSPVMGRTASGKTRRENKRKETGKQIIYKMHIFIQTKQISISLLELYTPIYCREASTSGRKTFSLFRAGQF